MINEQKIIDFLHNELKLARYEVKNNSIIVKSSIPNIEVLLDFVKPLNYYISFIATNGGIYINPKN